MKENFKVTLTGFHDIKDELPEEFMTCLLILKDNSVMIGHWEEGMVAKRHDPRGSFFDGIGGHLSPEHVLAWKNINEAVLENIES